jgi:hypothetical protein
MSLARADIRFLLPDPVRSASVLGAVDGWHAALERAGVELVAPASGPDLLVAPARHWREAAASGARGIVLDGADRRMQLRAAGLTPRAHLPAPTAADPTVLLPLDAPRVAHYALTRMVAPRSNLKVLRNHVLARVLTRGARLSGARLATTAAAAGGEPQLVRAAARELAVDGQLDWLLLPGRGDLLARCVLQLFPPGATEPHWVLKFARVRDYTDPFDRDEQGYRIAMDAGPLVTVHTPAPLGRFVVDGLHASVETAAPGATLVAYLHGRAPRERKLAKLDAIARWVLEVAVRTADPPAALQPELERLTRYVVPRWREAGAAFNPEKDLGGIPAVLQHNDLGSWNIVVDGDGFVALDWEAARRHALPLWDLLYLLTDALAHLDGVPSTLADRERHFVQLFRGELPSSRTLFSWVAAAVRRLQLPPERVGELASLCWMHHGLSPEARKAAIDQLGDPSPPSFWLQLIEQLARRWLSDPALGTGWSTWQAE